jgi:hypothetical protein
MPFQNQIHVDQLLSNISVKYKPADFIAQDVFPAVPVKKQSDLYRVYERNFRIPETNRANRAESREYYFEVSNASYLLKRQSLKSYISDTDAQNYDLADLRAETVEELTDVILRKMEFDVAELFTKTSWSLTVSLTAGNEFSANTTTSNPIPIFQTGTTTIVQNSGMMPNFGIIPRTGFVAMLNHISVLDRVKYTSADVDAGKLAALLDIEKLHIPVSSYDSSNNLGMTQVVGSIFNAENAFIGYRPSSAGPLKASSGYIFKNSLPMVKRWRDEERESEVIEVNVEYAAKVVASLSGYLICNII